jgi:hypothetical protein
MISNSRQGVALGSPEGRFPAATEDLRDRSTQLAADFFVEIDELGVQPGRYSSSDRRLSRTHESDQENTAHLIHGITKHDHV